jgi:molybdate transport system substrate-binding protein
VPGIEIMTVTTTMAGRARTLLLCTLVLGAAGRPAAAADLTVSAAASLTAVLPEIGRAFAKQHPGVTVRSNLAGTATLVQQIREGAPVDVFASADESSMKRVVDAGDVAGSPVIFARNLLEIVVQRGNPENVATLADLDRKGLVVALCGPEVPAGRYAREILARAGLPVPAASRELDVKAVVARIALGEADAGIVYATDVAAAGGRVSGVAIPAAQNVVARYPAAALKRARDGALAAAFVDFLRGAKARAILARSGFLPAP